MPRIVHLPGAAEAARSLARAAGESEIVAAADAAEAAAMLARWADEEGVAVAIGGSGLAADPLLLAALERAGGEPLHGFGVLVVTLARELRGAEAARARAAARERDGAILVVLPPDPALAAAAWTTLLAPLAASPEPASPLEPPPAVEPPPAPSPDEAPWRAALAAAGARLLEDRWADIPADLPAALRDVLARSGDRAPVGLAGGRTALAFGYPDLLRPTARVLLLVPGTGAWPELVVLHRHPRVAGVLPPSGEPAFLPGPPVLREAAERALGELPDDAGRLLAVDVDAAWFERDGRALRWDGRRLEDEGPAERLAASLALRWTSR